MSKGRSQKRKAESLDENVIDLSDVRNDTEARLHNSSSPGTKNAASQDTRASKKTSTQSQAIDLDALPDDRSVIDIESDDEDTSTPDEEFTLHEYVGSFHTKVVGIQYYRGQVTTHESVLLRREPNNEYDRNAIQVLNVNSAQVGHLPAQISLGLAPWLDNRVSLVEAAVKAKKQVYSIPITIDVFAHGSVASQLPTALARAGIQLEDNSRSHRPTDGTHQPPGAPTDLETLRAGSTTVSTRQATALLDQLSVKLKDLQKMKQARQPSRLRTKLLNYQLQGLHWMITKENPSLPKNKDLVQMWKRAKGDSGYLNVASNFTTNKAPVLGRGGLLADDMGLGKTLQVLALIVSQPEDTPEVELLDDISSGKNNKDKYSGATLVLCPASLMTNWSTQASEHVSCEANIDLEIYHGKSRSSKKTLESKELIISTYGTLKSEYKQMLNDNKKTTSGLFSVRWKRVILDEAHQIRNPKSQVSLAVAALKSSCHWALTGTPIVNSYNDLGSIIRFVGWSGGIESPEIFNAKLTRKLLSPGQHVQKEAVKLIQILMQDLSLRRRKDMEYDGKRLVELPTIKEYHHKLKFASQEESELYDKLAMQAQGILRRDSKQSQVLEILLRMRQACCAKSLINEERLRALDKLDSMDSVAFTEENKALLWEFLALAVESQETCPICLEYLSDSGREPVVTHCKHVFCRQCISSSISSKESCPLCRADLTQSQILGLPVKPVESTDIHDSETLQSQGSSTKIDELLRLLRAIKSQDATNKTVVFSQWTGMLDLVQDQLKREDMVICRVDGSMSLKARDAAISQLQDQSEHGASVMLASLAVASVGLNLTAANSVIMLDPWWNAAIADQAVDRVYRLGQTREVSVYKMVIEDSIEEKVLEIQDRKRKMTATIGAGQSRAQQVEARRADLETLLGS